MGPRTVRAWAEFARDCEAKALASLAEFGEWVQAQEKAWRQWERSRDQAMFASGSGSERLSVDLDGVREVLRELALVRAQVREAREAVAELSADAAGLSVVAAAAGRLVHSRSGEQRSARTEAPGRVVPLSKRASESRD